MLIIWFVWVGIALYWSEFFEQLVSFGGVDFVFVVNVMLVPGGLEIGFQVVFIILPLQILPVFNSFSSGNIGLVFGYHHHAVLAFLGVFGEKWLYEVVVLGSILFSLVKLFSFSNQLFWGFHLAKGFLQLRYFFLLLL